MATEAEAVPGEASLTPGEASAVLGLTTQALIGLEARGRLTAHRTLGGHRRYREAAVRALRAEQDALASGELLAPGQVAAMFRVSYKTVGRWVAAGMLTPVPGTGHPRKFRAEQARALMRGDGNGAP